MSECYWQDQKVYVYYKKGQVVSIGIGKEKLNGIYKINIEHNVDSTQKIHLSCIAQNCEFVNLDE